MCAHVLSRLRAKHEEEGFSRPPPPSSFVVPCTLCCVYASVCAGTYVCVCAGTYVCF
jgi:hypothetical protein